MRVELAYAFSYGGRGVAAAGDGAEADTPPGFFVSADSKGLGRSTFQMQKSRIWDWTIHSAVGGRLGCQ